MRARESGSDVDLRLTTKHLESRQMWDCRSSLFNLHMSLNKPPEILQHHRRSLKDVHSTACRHQGKEKHDFRDLYTISDLAPATSWFPFALRGQRSHTSNTVCCPQISPVFWIFWCFYVLQMITYSESSQFYVEQHYSRLNLLRNSSHWSAVN